MSVLAMCLMLGLRWLVRLWVTLVSAEVVLRCAWCMGFVSLLTRWLMTATMFLLSPSCRGAPPLLATRLLFPSVKIADNGCVVVSAATDSDEF